MVKIMTRKKTSIYILLLFLALSCVIFTQNKSVALKAQKFFITEGKSSQPIHMVQSDTSNPVYIFVQFFKNQEIRGLQQELKNDQASKFLVTTEKNLQKSMISGKLQNFLKLRITSKSKQIVCIFDQSTDLCTIQKPQSEYNINIDCLINQNSKSKQCLGQIYIKQVKPYVIPYEQVTTQNKIKYNDGFYELPQTQSHSLMLLFCQDQKSQVNLARSINIYSNIKFHRKQNLEEQETNQMVGFESSKGIKSRYVYFQIKSEAVRKCLEFQYHVSNSLTNGKFMLDFVNMTDKTTMAQNIYTYYSSSDLSAKDNHFFNYNMNLQVNIFSPNHLSKQENYNMIVNVFELDPKISQKDKEKSNDIKNLKQISNYTFSSIIPKTETHRDTHFYAKYNHYHYTFILSHEFLKNSKFIKVQVLIVPIASDIIEKDNYLFIGLKVQDTQNIIVQQLTPSYLSIKQGQSLSFTIEQPFQINEIQASGSGDKVSDLVTIIPSSENLISTITQHSTDHEHKSECHFSQGCKFTLLAKKDCVDCVINYKAEFIQGKNDVLLLQIKNNKISGRIQLDQYLYFYYKLGPAELVQVIINNPNIIVYILDDDNKKRQCKLPSKTCNSDVATFKQPTIIQNKATIGEKLVYIAVKGLDNSQFTIRFQKFQNQVKLTNGQIFSYRLSKVQDQMKFIFEVPEFISGKPYSNSISFNLISPLNSLQMFSSLLNQKNQELQESEKHSTMSGFIKLQPSQIKSRRFLIRIKKQLHFGGESVHFSIIASTSDQRLKLDAGVTHYQSLSPKQSKKFIIQYMISQEYSLSFHTFNVVGKQVHVDLDIQQAQQQQQTNLDKSQRNIISYAIDKAADKLYLNSDFQNKHHICQDSVDTCQLVITLKNQMAHSIDITLLLMGKQSIIELKDGVWQSFKVDQLLKMSHFYFIPTHQSNPVKILFKSTNPDLSLEATLFQTGDYINPSQWPFPQTHGHTTNTQLVQKKYSSNQQIVIDHQDSGYKSCFPDCVVLISLRDDGSYIDQFNQGDSSQTISILAQNFLIQLPQKTKITLELKQNEENLIFIDLRKLLDKKVLTFFTFFGVGFAQIYANVYWPVVQNIPTIQQHQIVFDPYETQTPVQSLKQLWLQLVQQDQLDDEQIQVVLETQQVYLCLLIVADQPTKMMLQFTSDKSTIKQMHLGMTEAINFKAEQESILYFIPTKDYRIKFIRNSGYPFFHILTCDHTDNQQCLQYGLKVLRQGGIKQKQNLNKERKQIVQQSTNKLQDGTKVDHDGPFALMNFNQKQGNHQMIQKTQSKYGRQCSKCIIYIWAYSIEDAELTIQLHPMNNQIELQENHLISQYLNQNQVNKYFISAIRNQWTVITVHILQGSPIVKVSDNLQFQQTQTKSTINLINGLQNNYKMMIFKIPPIQIHETKAQQKSQGQQLDSLFNSLHISIQSQDKKPVSYTISYSSGEHILYLDDGVISSHILNKNQPSSFYYKNKNKKSHVYLTMTVQTSNYKIQKILQSMIIKMYYIQNLEGATQKKLKGQISPQKPNSQGEKKKTTLTFELPSYELIQIEITSPQDVKLTIGINHRQIIFLPLNYAFPVQLHAKQQIQIIIQNLMDNAYLEFIIKKCDQSNPLIYYTNDQTQFIQDTFSNYDRFGQENIFKHVSKTKDKGTLYLKLAAIDLDSTLVVEARYINLDYAYDKIDLSAGNYGILQYQLINSQMAQITLSGLQCIITCIDSTQYYLVVSENLQNIYQDMVCEGHSFQQMNQFKEDTKENVTLNKSNKKSIQIHKLIQKPGRTDNKMVVPYKLISPISFVTIKAVHTPTGQQVYYRHVEITTLTGHLNRLPLVYLYFGLVIFILGIGAVVTTTKIWARRGYQPLRVNQ